MEKFGIFNILSALSSLTANKKGSENDDKQASSPNFAPEKNTPQTNKPDNSSAVFAPPAFPSYQPMLDFIKKHDELSKRIDKNNKIN